MLRIAPTTERQWLIRAGDNCHLKASLWGGVFLSFFFFFSCGLLFLENELSVDNLPHQMVRNTIAYPLASSMAYPYHLSTGSQGVATEQQATNPRSRCF
jgi:hypothetical protein